jgi:long-subunit acyl-CoA synthetase (AMP-forming)
MTELKQVFGSLEKPVELASLLFVRSKRSALEDKLQSAGNVVLVDEIESKANALTRSLVSLGLSSGDHIALYGVDYSDALSLFIASGQVGVNVINLSSSNDIEQLGADLIKTKARAVFFGNKAEISLGRDFLNLLTIGNPTYYPEYAIVQGALESLRHNVLTWAQFQQLERFSTPWEIGLLRVV